MDFRSAQLVVLSICNGGIYRFGPGDEPYGMISALLTAGARNLVGTLWRIEDIKGRRFMVDFYVHLLECGPAEALRRTACKLIQSEVSLRDWAAFLSGWAWASFSINSPLVTTAHLSEASDPTYRRRGGPSVHIPPITSDLRTPASEEPVQQIESRESFCRRRVVARWEVNGHTLFCRVTQQITFECGSSDLNFDQSPSTSRVRLPPARRQQVQKKGSRKQR